MAARSFLIALAAAFIMINGCTNEGNGRSEQRAAPLVILRPMPKLLTIEQRSELGFPDDIIEKMETAAEAKAEPFFEQVLMKSSNLKGDVLITGGKLAGFSVRTARADEIILRFTRGLRVRGFVIFRSGQNFGRVPDIVTVVRGNSSYDILKIQQTESDHYHLDTNEIIAWLRKQQSKGSFVVTGAGADWVEARFIEPPQDMRAFARDIVSFAPDVLREDHRTVSRLAEWMEEANSFRLVWD